MLVLLALAAMLSTGSPATPAGFERCRVGLTEGRCGTIAVPERRHLEAGRSIDLFVAVIPAPSESRQPEPIVVLEGGPGASVTHFAPLHVQTFAGALRSRDLVLFDQRGTGRSAALDCDLMDGFRSLPTPEIAAACADDLSNRADPAYYTTDEAVEDLAAVLDRLGYERATLFGISNGTRTVLRFLARYPDRVRSIILLGPYPTTHNVLLDGGEALDLSLDGLTAACAGDVTCAASYPGLAATIERLPARFAADRGWPLFAAGLRMMMFFPLQASRVPQVLDAVQRSGRLPEVSAAAPDDPQVSLLAGWISQGAFMSLICSEDASRASIEDIRQRTTGTFLGPGWAESLLRSCEVWPRKPLPADFGEPVAGDVPALLLVGSLDPAVQPAWAHEIAANLPQARVIEVPEGQHSFIGMTGVTCVVQLMSGFIDTDSADGLDASCAGEMRRPAFQPPIR